MNIKVAKSNNADPAAMRDVYREVMVEMAEKDSRVYALDADLISAIGMSGFQKDLPERIINCGIQEANMMGVAAGLSLTGLIPFAHTFGPFATRRAFDQIFISAGLSQNNVKIFGSDPGITAAFNGGTHMPFEDTGIMRAIPDITILEPTDCAMLRNLLPKIKDTYGLFYVRLVRKASFQVFEEGSDFEIGKAALVREGADATIIASGYCVVEAIKAAADLQEKGISVRVIDSFTIKPIDKEAVIKAARETGAIVTAENHNIFNGLGSAVAEVLAENCPVPMERVGVQDKYGQVGPVDYLAKVYELTAETIAAKVEKVMARKK